MKTILNKTALLCAFGLCCILAGCSNAHEEWEDGDPAMAHIYYYCFAEWGSIPGGNDIIYSVEQGETLAVPTQFYSSFIRPYNPEVYYYTSPVPNQEELVCGTDYIVVDKDGNALTPDASGAYTMIWPKAEKAVQNIYIKALNAKKGALRVLTFSPDKKMDVTDVSTTSIIKTAEYEVRAFSENYFVTVSIK